jgi:hypothetical protein
MQKTNRPVVFVCEANCRIGVTPLADFIAASASFWQDVDQGIEPYNCNEFRSRLGRLITIKDPQQVFVFESGSPDYLRLINCCFVQRATFFVPDVPANQLNQLGKASVYILGDNE